MGSFRKHDLGLDFSLFNDKLNGTIDYFHEQREGIYMQRSYLPFSIGLLEYQPLPMWDLLNQKDLMVTLPTIISWVKSISHSVPT